MAKKNITDAVGEVLRKSRKKWLLIHMRRHQGDLVRVMLEMHAMSREKIEAMLEEFNIKESDWKRQADNHQD